MAPRLTDSQRVGARFLATQRVAYLADVPGLGKTAQYIRAVDLTGHRTFTVICPPVLRSKLQAEVTLWSRIGHHVTAIETSRDEVPRKGALAISYSLATRPDVLARLMERERGPLIFDEAHALKEPEAQRTMRMLGRGGLASRASHVWWISGTPAPNHAGELYVFARAAGLWRYSWEQFCAAFCETRYNPHERKRVPVGSRNQEELRALLAPAFLRRTEVEGRPALAIDDISVPGSDAFADLAPEHAEEIREALAADAWDFPNVDAMSTVRRLVGLAKVPATIDLALTELESGHRRLLIFGTHIDVLEKIAEGLRARGRRAEVLNGSTSAKRAHAITSEFQDPAGVLEVLCINIVSGGTALTLTAASRVLVVEPSWVPAENGQAVARAWRRGQTNPVHASFIGLAGSLDDVVTQTVARKVRDLEKLLD